MGRVFGERKRAQHDSMHYNSTEAIKVGHNIFLSNLEADTSLEKYSNKREWRPKLVSKMLNAMY